MTLPQIVLLHGALGSSRDMKPLADGLCNDFKVFTPDFPGHGNTPIGEHALNADGLVQFTEAFITKHLDATAPIIIFGYSMGGYIGLLISERRKIRIDATITLATKLEWTPEIADKEIRMLNPEKMREKVPGYVEMLKNKHSASDWKWLVLETAEFLHSLGHTSPVNQHILEGIPSPVLFLVGENDHFVSHGETEKAAASAGNGNLAVLPNTPHILEKMDIHLVAGALSDFLAPIF